MDKIYNQEYYENYDMGLGKVNYKTCTELKDTLDSFAESIAKLGPKTVLDVGCAMGHLVDALRARGIEAYGIDLSEYAISQVSDQIRPYCAVCSATEELPDHFPQHFDMVVTIEVMEHIPPENADLAVSHLCKWGDTVLFSSTPDDFEDPTHVNVRPREYWASLFAQNGFYDDVESRPSFITWYSMCFRRGLNTQDMVDHYERGIRSLQEEHHVALKQATSPSVCSQIFWGTSTSPISEHNSRIFTSKDENGSIHFELDLPEDVCALRLDPHSAPCIVKNLSIRCQSGDLTPVPVNGTTMGKYTLFLESDPQYTLLLNGHHPSHLSVSAVIIPIRHAEEVGVLSNLETLHQQLESTQQAHHSAQAQLASCQTRYQSAIKQREELRAQLNQIQAAYDATRNAFCWKITKPVRVCLDLLKRPLRRIRCMQLLRKGLRCWRQNGTVYTLKKVKHKLENRQNYQALAKRALFTPEELEKQKLHRFPRDITFSIIVPLYNTPPQFLKEMIQSVLDQTYANWELCLADGSDDAHGDVEKICLSYSKKHPNVKYKKLEQNLGISGNTNACLEMATGDYIGLFDHDDLLHPAALYEVMRTICETDADFVYTDELTFSGQVSNIITAHFKPDFAPDNLRANNYICHFSVFSKEVLQAAGPFSSEYDGSQDHDFILRATEKAKKVVHIPEILYFWRSHPNSVAENINSKTYAIDAGKRAVADHIKRQGMDAIVESSVAFPTIYRIRYQLMERPLISIVIPNRDHYEDISRCLESILNFSTYENFEVIVVDNGSVDPQVLRLYDSVTSQSTKVKVLHWDHPFNYSAINNYACRQANGKYLLLLNSDTQIITPDWMEEMLMYAQRHDVGVVGAKLYYADDTIQHAGVILGMGADRVAGHAFYHTDHDNVGYMGRLYYAQNYSAVTGACMMVSKELWDQLGGLDEELQVALNDVDFCMRARRAGYLVVWTPYAELYHFESKCRGAEDTPAKQARFQQEVSMFKNRWKEELEKGDPYYNPNFSLDRSDFSLS